MRVIKQIGSWVLGALSKDSITKVVDFSVFKYKGTAIPTKLLYWFGMSVTAGKTNITILHENSYGNVYSYNARIQPDAQGRFRMFWGSDLDKVIRESFPVHAEYSALPTMAQPEYLAHIDFFNTDVIGEFGISFSHRDEGEWRFELPKAAVEAIIRCAGNDGHSILKESSMRDDKDIPSWFLEGMVRDHGGGGGKFDVFDEDGENVILKGIHTLDMLSRACAVLDLDSGNAIGRGTQACYYTTALRDWVNAQ